MKHFIVNILQFTSMPIIIGIVLFVSFKYKINNIILDKSKHIVIMGDSHTQSGLNDSIIENSINISQSGEHFLYSYNVLRILLKKNQQIDKVILGVSFHSFGISYDNYIKDSEKTKFMFPKYYPILNYESLLDVPLIHIREFIGMTWNVLKANFSSSIHEYPFFGKFYKSEKSYLNDSTVNIAIQRHYYTSSGSQQEYSNYQKKYLEKIVKLCYDGDIQLILINTPISDRYYVNIPEKFITNYYKTIENIGLNKIQFIDLHSYDLDEKCYGDVDHLNSIGAKKISIIVKEKIKNLPVGCNYLD